MKNYVKPVIIANDELAEGVYLASGEPDCWTIDGKSVQDWNGSHNVFEIRTVHSTGMQHISTATDVAVSFNYTLTDAYSEFPCTFSGNTAYVHRELLGDAYKSGDVVTFKIWASTGDEATTKALAITGKTITCTKAANVQGQGGDGN